jgi:hypothetical protein
MSRISDLGFIPIEELGNVRATKLRELEEKVFPTCPSVERRADQAFVMDFFDGIFLELQKRAQANMADYLRKNPALKQEAREARKTESETKTQESYQERVKRGRAIAMGKQD